jgi:PAS domain S-box-containing protein
MVQKHGEQIRECRERAHAARRAAETTANPVLRREFLEIEKRWLALGHSHVVAERVAHFTAPNSPRRPPRISEQILAYDRPDDPLRLRKVITLLSHGDNLDALFESMRLVSVVEFSDDAIISKDLDGIITSWNRGAERLFGYSAKGAIGLPVTVLMPPEYRDEEKEILESIRRGNSVEHYETVRWCKDGRLVDVLLTVSPIRDAERNVVGASEIVRDITERKRTEAQISVLAREAEHRAKNLLASVQAIVRLSESDTPDGLRQAIEGRIGALANVHSLFVRSRWTGAELGSLVRQELSPYSRGGEMRTRIDGPPVTLKPDLAQTIAMVLHELATNAAKYGALSVAEGQVHVEWSHPEGGQLVLRWTEAGGPPVSPPTRRGFGTGVIANMIRDRAKGEVRTHWHTGGLACEIVVQT